MADLVKIVDMVNQDLKELYKESPSGAWLYPCVVFGDNDGGVKALDGKLPDDKMFDWVRQNLNVKKLAQIVVGRMVVKYGEIIDPNTNQPMIKEKAIMVMGRDFKTNRTRLIVTPCREHRDYRTPDEIDKQSQYDPSIKAADTSKMLVDADGRFYARMTGKFLEAQVYDTRNGHQFLTDPLIDGISQLRNIKEDNVTDVSDPMHIIKPNPIKIGDI